MLVSVTVTDGSVSVVVVVVVESRGVTSYVVVLFKSQLLTYTLCRLTYVVVVCVVVPEVKVPSSVVLVGFVTVDVVPLSVVTEIMP